MDNNNENSISDLEKAHMNGRRKKSADETVREKSKSKNSLIDGISHRSITLSVNEEKTLNGNVAGKKLQWMFTRFGIKQKSRFEVVSPGPSGVFKQVKLEENKFQDSSLNDVEWPSNPAFYDLEKVIGFGATAKVYEATCIKSAKKCAVKKVFLDNDQISFINLWKETRSMMQCRHENIIQCYTSFVDKRDLWLVLGYMDGGSVLDIIEHCASIKGSSGEGLLEEKFISSILKQVILGLIYIHRCGIIHRDIKAGNILFNLQGCIKIADFGVATQLRSSRDRRLSFIGTPCWMAPEVIQQQDGYNVKADIWSLGITTIEMATGKVPNQDDSTLEVIIKTLRNTSPTLDSVASSEGQYIKYSSAFKRFLHVCLKKKPENRPFAAELLKMPLIKAADDAHYIADQILNYIIMPVHVNNRVVHPFFDKNFRDKPNNENHSKWNFEVEQTLPPP